MTSASPDDELSPLIPQIDLQITSAPVQAQTRKLKMSWSTGAVQDFYSDFGLSPWPRRPDNILDIINDALEDPNYDPDSEEEYKGLWRWQDGRVATPEEVRRAKQTPEERIIEDAANAMKAEIDKEVLRELMVSAEPEPAPKAVQLINVKHLIPTCLARAIHETPADEGVKQEFRRIWSAWLARAHKSIKDDREDPPEEEAAE